MFLALAPFAAPPHLIDALQSQSLLPNGYRHPHGPLIVLEPVAGDPGGSAGELDIVEDDEDIAEMHLIEKPGERSKIWPAGGYDHDGTTLFKDGIYGIDNLIEAKPYRNSIS